MQDLGFNPFVSKYLNSTQSGPSIPIQEPIWAGNYLSYECLDPSGRVWDKS